MDKLLKKTVKKIKTNYCQKGEKMYCTIEDFKKLLPKPISMGDQNIGTPSPGLTDDDPGPLPSAAFPPHSEWLFRRDRYPVATGFHTPVSF